MDDSKIIFSGCMGGIAQTLVGHPLDTIKVRYIERKDKSIINCVKYIKKTGYKNFYKGVSVPILGSVFSGAQCFYTFSLFKNYTNNDFLAGALSGVVLSLTEGPSDAIKTRMQISPNADYVKTIHNLWLKKELTKGLGATIIRNSFSTGVFFSSYTYTKKTLSKKSYNEYTNILVAGSVAGSLSWGLNYPMDNIKTRLQTDTGNKYKGILDCLKKTKFKYLWNGFSVCIARAIIVNPFIFMAYELSIKILD